MNIKINELSQQFNKYYKSLSNKKDIFYIYFTSGMLMFLAEALCYLPSCSNIVLLASDLEEDEVEYIKRKCLCEFYYFGNHNMDDREVWHILFEVNQNHFGWIDVDCFVNNNQALNTISKISFDTAINGYSSILAWENVYVLRTYFIFINIDIAKNLQVSPYMYRYPFQTDDGRGAFMVPEQHISMLEKIIPIGKYYAGLDHFDTTIYYQVFALCNNYKLFNIHGNHTEIMFDEDVFHLGRSSLISLLKKDQIKQEYITSSFYNAIVLYVSKRLLDKYRELPHTYIHLHNKINQHCNDFISNGFDFIKAIKLLRTKEKINSNQVIDNILF